MSFRNALGGLSILGLLVAAGLLSYCSSPTEPAPPPPPGDEQQPNQLTITTATDSLTFNETTTVTVQVNQAQVNQVGLTTDLGNFGLDGSAQPIQSLTLTLSGGRSTSEFSAGTEAGVANLRASFAAVVEAVQVEISPPPPLFLKRLDPTFGPPDGGTPVMIFGQGMRESPRVTFGGALAEFLSGPTDDPSGDQVIVVNSPQSHEPVAVGSTLVVDVAVSFPDDGTGQPLIDTLEGAFTYAHGGTPVGPAIFSVQPATGPNRGGVPVAILGSGFEAGNASVAFGTGETIDTFTGIEAQVSSATPERIDVTLPAAPPELLNQTVGVLVRNLSTGLSTLASSVFTYAEQDIVNDIQPRSASYMGGTPVTISTRGIDDQTILSVEFGGVFQATCPSGTCSITPGGTSILLPARAVSVRNCAPPQGVVMLTDTVTGEMSSGPNFMYTTEVPSLQNVSPGQGNQDGGSAVTLRGQFSILRERTLVLIDDVVAPLSSSTATTIQVQVPPFTGVFDEISCGAGGRQFVPKPVDVEVLFSDTGCSDKQPGAYTYLPNDQSCRSGPGAGFTFNVSGPDRLDVQFTDTSAGSPTAWQWTFGDGTSSNEQNPSHTYLEGGTFNVTLQVTSAGGMSSVTQAVKVGPDPPRASFTFSASPSDPLRVSFVDDSRNDPSSWSWLFGDGGTSNAQNPTHTYAAGGTYSVTLTVTNVTGSDRITQEVKVGPDPPRASFTFNLDTSDPDLLSVVFLDTSDNGPTSWEWSFGDGATSTSQNPTHTYATAGTFNVTLRVSNQSGSDSATQAVRVGPTPPQASFTFSFDGSDPNRLTVDFLDTSDNGPTSWEWNFGDGTTSNQQNPSKTYTTPGTFNVTLTASNAGGSDTVTQSVQVGLDPPEASFSFDFDPMDAMRLTVSFFDTSTNNPTTWLWRFGDGSPTSNLQTPPAHVYAAAGTYSVTLTVTNAGGSDTVSQNVTVGTTSLAGSATPRASFTHEPTGVRRELRFADTSTGVVIERVWDFGDGFRTNQEQPTHQYKEPGFYTVTLEVSNEFGTDDARRQVRVR